MVGAVVDDPGDASLVMALLRAIEDGEDLKLDRDDGLFGDTENVVSDSVVGSPTIPSLSVFEQWALAQGLSYQAAVRPVRRRQHKPVPDAQMSLF